jgi:flagellar hook protein FlgE
LALDGDGLLLVKDKSGALGGTRTGAFHLTQEGRLQDAKGLTLQGWTLPSETPEEGEATSAAFIGPLGALENIQLIKSESTPPAELVPLEKPVPPEELDLSNLYGTGLSMQKEADGVYSFHGSASYLSGSYVGISVHHTLVDSLGNEHAVNMEMEQSGSGRTLISLSPLDSNANPSISAFFQRYTDGNLYADNYGTGTSYTLDTIAEQMVITFMDTGAHLILDISDTQATYGGSHPSVGPGETLSWSLPPIIFEEGTYEVLQESEVIFSSGSGFWGLFQMQKGEDGSFIGRLKDNNGGIFSVDFYFNEEGWVSGYKFTRNACSSNDPSVGVVQTGSLAEVHFVDTGGVDYGTSTIDLSAIRIINRTGADLVINGSTIKPVTSSGESESTSAASGTALSEGSLRGAASAGASAPLSPSSLSIDENGVLKRLKDNGDWEPVYLLACGQFAAMNTAEERNGVYYATPASGALRTGVSGREGMGTITSGTLERSTTDLAHELSEMIRAQHAYAANTKVLSTLDDMLEELERL